MPFRERLKKTFSRTSSTGASDTSSLSKTTTNGTTLDYRTNPNVYKPGEKMPPMKYRRPVAKEHKEKLEAFSFAKAWRRKSHNSVYSPMGSRMPSRAGSVTTGPSRNGSVMTAGTSAPRKSFQRGGSLDVPPDGTLDEGKDEMSDVTNVGHYRQQTNGNATGAANSRTPMVQRNHSSRSAARPRSPLANGTTNPSTEDGAEHFTQTDLNLALKKSHLEVPKA